MNWARFEVFMEFLVFGIVIGVVEDIIAVAVVTDEPITWQVIWIVLLIAIPFAAIGELLVDRIDFVNMFRRRFGRKKD